MPYDEGVSYWWDARHQQQPSDAYRFEEYDAAVDAVQKKEYRF